MEPEFELAGQVPTADNPYLVAEMGTNHDRDLQTARDIVDVAATAGVDAIKYQVFHGKDIVSEGISPEEYGLDEYFDESSILQIYDEHLRLPREWLPELVEYASEQGLDNVATVSCADCARFAVEVGVDALKVASMDLTHGPLLAEMAAFDRPIILSSGFASLGEVDDALACLRTNGHDDHALLHCISQYPAPSTALNLRTIRTLDSVFDLPVGFSDHSRSPLTPALAVAHGARIVEKHITLSRDRPGPDHAFALEPEELERMVSAVDIATASSGSPGLHSPAREDRERYRRSVVTERAIAAGETINSDNVRFARPGNGIPPTLFEKVEGAEAVRDISAETPVKWDDIL